MKSSGPYHRGNSGASGFDYCAAFIYTVLPTRTPGAALFGSTHRQSGSVSVPWLHLSAAAGPTCRPALCVRRAAKFGCRSRRPRSTSGAASRCRSQAEHGSDSEPASIVGVDEPEGVGDLVPDGAGSPPPSGTRWCAGSGAPGGLVRGSQQRLPTVGVALSDQAVRKRR